MSVHLTTAGPRPEAGRHAAAPAARAADRCERRKRLVLAAALPLSVLVSAGLVWQASSSAFSASTHNPSSNWATGTVSLSDDDSGTALFDVANLKPGQAATRCIAVTSTGSLPAAVRLYGSSYTQTRGLGSFLSVTVEEGSGGSFGGGCAGFTASGSPIFSGTLDAFGTARLGFSTGVGSWAPTGSGSETRVYRIAYQLSGSTPDSAQGGAAGVGFTWEAQNT